MIGLVGLVESIFRKILPNLVVLVRICNLKLRPESEDELYG